MTVSIKSIRSSALFCLTLWLFCLPVQAAAASLNLVKSAARVDVFRNGQPRTLDSNLELAAGDQLITWTQGRASLRFQTMLMTLGPDSELVVAGVEAPDSDQPPVLLLHLVRGVLRIDGKAGGRPQDMRLNVGDIRMRLIGSDVWARVDKSQHTVCLLDGQVDLRTSFGPRKLEAAGDCLVVDGGGQQVEQPDYPAMLARLALTDYADPVTAGARTEPPPVALGPVLPPPAAAQAPAPLQPQPLSISATDGPASGGWTLVALALVDPDSAKAEAQGFVEQGLPGIVRPLTAPDGRRVYRVTIGSFATREQAQIYNAQVKARYGLPQLWIAPY